jgi:hypothetical protein
LPSPYLSETSISESLLEGTTDLSSVPSLNIIN